MAMIAILEDDQDLKIVDPMSLTESLYTKIIFLCHSADESFLDALGEEILRVEKDLVSGTPAALRSPNNGYYVYGYFENGESDWGRLFYVGKGKNNRRLSHAGNVLNTLAHNGLPVEKKDVLISEYIRDHNVTHLTQVDNSLVRVLYKFDGVYSEALSFFVEYFLVHRARGASEISNRTEGNNRCGDHRGLARPKSFNRDSGAHETLWRSAVAEFINDASSKRLNNTYKPALRFIGFDDSLTVLNKTLGDFDFTPFDVQHVSENRIRNGGLMIAPNCSVSGAADAMISYRSKAGNKPYRIDLRLKTGSSSTIINVRPLSNSTADKRAFLHFFDNLRLSGKDVVINEHTFTTKLGKVPDIYANYNLSYPIKNRNDWPFFKPMELTDNGSRAEGIKFELLDLNIKTTCSPPWLESQEVQLTLAEALGLINKVFQ